MREAAAMEALTVIAEVGDFRVLPCHADAFWLERISTGEGTDVPCARLVDIIQMPPEQREAALERCWGDHF